jgi:uncharacterized membrane protein
MGQPQQLSIPAAAGGRAATTLRIASLAALLVAFALRLDRLGAESLWYDETVSAYLASLSLPQLIAHTALDIHPPAYYLLLHGWRAVAQPTLTHGLEFLFTWPSLWFGLIATALLAPITLRLASREAAVITLWLAALNPFQILYAQEARMYTVGATCLLLTLWAALKLTDDCRLVTGDFQKQRSAVASQQSAVKWHRWLLLYVIAAVAGLYTLYYFLFWIGVLIVVVALVLIQSKTPHGVRDWLIAQVAVLLGWLPWLPIFLHQAAEPPVPAWRVAWQDWRQVAAALAEGMAAFWVGQSPPGAVAWPWALGVVLVLLAYFGYTKSDARPSLAPWLPLLLLGPFAFIVAVSILVTPLYHIRYLIIYAPLFLVIAGAFITALLRPRPVLAATAALILILGSLLGINRFHYDPALRADDHRQAVADLARLWRPGDAILVNAGWVYTALAVYWPTSPESSADAVPPPIAGWPRLSDYSDGVSPPLTASSSSPWPPVVAIRTGSVDGDPSLGWGNPTSDFYAITTADTLAGLATLAESYQRLWHYRLYDTVNDPVGTIRAWLDAQGEPVATLPYAGPGYLQLQGIPLHGESPPYPFSEEHATQFGEALKLTRHRTAPTIKAGSNLYVELIWQWLQNQNPANAEQLAASLRLYAPDGTLAAQTDAPLSPTTTLTTTSALALGAPAATPPGLYSLTLVVYRTADLTPLPVQDEAADTGRGLPLGEIQID